MKKYNLNSIFFSPAYTTASVVNYIAEGMASCCAGEEPAEHDLSAPGWSGGEIRFNSGDLAIFGAPVYSGRIPKLAADRLKTFKGDNTPAVITVVYGNRAYEDALLELKDLVEAQGFNVIGAAVFVAQHCMLTDVAQGRPDIDDKAKAIEFGQKCAWKLVNLEQAPAEQKNAKLEVPGNSPYREVPAGPGPRPLGDDSCTNCQACVNNCPVQAIPAGDPKSTGDACFACCRCIAVCPVQARKLPEPVRDRLEQFLGPLRSVRHEPEFYL
ncbi:hypothetical protein LJC48_05205 [Desulfovibrio sp. OttesenSCG-928-C06]|nr:hypothetical protein [Desulfovibrio sp. OttesenSCG-928-C06]